MKVDLVQFNNLGQYEEISHCFTTKNGGMSSGVFASLNMGFGRGDDDQLVFENYKLVSKQINLDFEKFVLSNQVHKDTIKVVTHNDAGKGLTQKSDIIGVDGLMTNEKGIGLVTFYADCVPLFFYDPVTESVAVSHGGWKGTILQIGKKTIEQMETVYSAKRENIIVAIGPSVCGSCYEVSEDVKKQFDLSFNDDIIAKVAKKSPSKAGKFYIDLKLTHQLYLQACGVPAINIEVSPLCTMCDSDRFFSHRVMGKERGSQVGIIGLKD